jgi:hypothetical protein
MMSKLYEPNSNGVGRMSMMMMMMMIIIIIKTVSSNNLSKLLLFDGDHCDH